MLTATTIGIGFCIGLGIIHLSLTFVNLPLKVNFSSVHAFVITSIDSRNLSVASSTSTPNPSNSCNWYPLPTPKSNLPLLKTSIIAASEAIIIGL